MESKVQSISIIESSSTSSTAESSSSSSIAESSIVKSSIAESSIVKSSSSSTAEFSSSSTAATNANKDEEVLFSVQDNKSMKGTESKVELKYSSFIPESRIVIESANLLCPICYSLFTEPKQITSCGHVFCSSCLSDHLTKFSHDCPICRKTINTPIIDNNIKRMIAKLIVYCKYRNHGCSWQNSMGDKASDYIKHIVSCSLRGKFCAQGCGVVVEWSDETDHQKIICPFTLIKCSYDECPDSVARKNFDEHKLSCDYRPVDCEFKHFGFLASALCNEKIQHRHYQKHLNDYALDHCRVASVAYEEMKKNCEEVKKNCEEVKRNCEEMKKKFLVEEKFLKEEKMARENLAAEFKLESKRLIIEKQSLEEKLEKLENKTVAGGNGNRILWIIKGWGEIDEKYFYHTHSSDFNLYGKVWKMKCKKDSDVVRLEYELLYNIATFKADAAICLVNPQTMKTIHRSTGIRDMKPAVSWGGDFTKYIDAAWDLKTDSIGVELIVYGEPVEVADGS